MRPLSARNPRIQRLTKLVKRRGEREDQRAFVVEGPVLVAAALDAGLHVQEVYVDEEAAGRSPVRDLLHRLPDTVEVWSLVGGLLQRVGDVATSQGVLAVVARPHATWPRPEQAPFVLVLAELADPGNLGTLIRAGVAAGAGAAVFAGGADPWAPKVVRASAGALFSVDVVQADTPADAVDELHARRYATVATVVRGGTPYDQVDLSGPVAVVLGNEAHGLAAEIADACTLGVTIPMAGPTESLNVAMAGTVLAFEVLRQRRAAP